MNIILVGFMGSGKTTLGKQLAKKRKMQFIDTDKEIELKTEMTISEIFQQSGEAYFRILECNLVEQFQEVDNCVIATGGGMPCHHQLMQKLLKIGICVHLKCTANEIMLRIQDEIDERPMFQQFQLHELESQIENLLKQREPFYNLAPINITFSEQNINRLLEIFI